MSRNVRNVNFVACVSSRQGSKNLARFLYFVFVLLLLFYRGDKLTIMYDPGFFPALLQSGSRLEQRNGGVPQQVSEIFKNLYIKYWNLGIFNQGNLSAHLAYFKQHVDELVPDVNNKGLVIVDFESWRPTFR